MRNVEVLSDDRPGFFQGLAAIARGDAKLVGERWTVDGVREIAVASATRPNEDGVPAEPEKRGRVTIGSEWFALALKDYEDWKEKWWREVVQNAVDAGATKVECEAVVLPDGTWKVSCTDNGRGMSEDVILNKFLVLGGTTKIVGGTTGGFGKAKELIILPWISWSVTSLGTEVTGTGVDYVVRKARHRQGTTVSVIMPADNHTSESEAISFVAKCWLPEIRFEVNGKKVKADLQAGENIKNFEGKGDVYYNQDDHLSFSQLLVRSNGIYHFGIYLSNSVPGVLLLELTGRSIDLLTANRDGFRDHNLKYAVQNFVSTIAADILSSLQSKKGGMMKRYKGSGKFQAAEKELRESVLGDLNINLAPTERLSEDQIESFIDAVLESRERRPSRRLPESGPRPSLAVTDRRSDYDTDDKVETVRTVPSEPAPGAGVVSVESTPSGAALVQSPSPPLPLAAPNDPAVKIGEAIPANGVARLDVVEAIGQALTTPREEAPPAASPTTSGDLAAVADEALLPPAVVNVVARDVAQDSPATPEADVPDESPEADEEMDGPLDLRVTPEAVHAHLDTGIKGSNHIEAAIKQIAWEPDFFILNHKIDQWSGDVVKGGEIYRVPRRFLPEHMAPSIRKLARLWAELCRFVLIQLGSNRSFGVGWVFSERTLACHFRAENEPWLLLNPFKHGRMKRPRETESGRLYSASDLDDLDLLYALAVHECTHLADGVSRHDESFASALTLNIARTYGRARQVRAIRAAVVSRKFASGKLHGR